MPTRSNITLRSSLFLSAVLFLSGLLSSCVPVEPPAEMNPATEIPQVTPESIRMEPASPTPTPPTASLRPSPTKPAAIFSPQQEGIAVLGDSFYDEYQGSDQRGGEYAAVAFNPVEMLVRLRGFNLGAWGDWGHPRRVGYEYNWAHSGDTSADLIQNGQHLGAAQQVREGKVSFVFIGVGANDFAPYTDDYARIYSGEMSDPELAHKVQQAIIDMTLAVDTILEAEPKGLAITLFTQFALDPQIEAQYPDAERRERVAEAVDAVNEGLAKMAAERGVIVVDQNKIGQEVVLPYLEDGFLDVGGQKIDFIHNGDSPLHSRLGDNWHLGTVASGVTANYYFIDTLNAYFGTDIPRMTEEEILSAAGLD